MKQVSSPGEKLYEELLLDKERNDEAVYEKIFVGNIKGYSIQKVMDFVKSLPQDDEQLAKDIVTFANASNSRRLKIEYFNIKLWTSL